MVAAILNWAGVIVHSRGIYSSVNARLIIPVMVVHTAVRVLNNTTQENAT